MNAILESVAARAANGWQRAGAKFDFEVLAMPGGSVMAPALWVYSMVSERAEAPRAGIPLPRNRRPMCRARSSAPGAATQELVPGLHCDWEGCHCT